MSDAISAHAAALMDALGRSGAREAEVGYLNDDPPFRWWARCRYGGQALVVEDHATVDLALLDLARRCLDRGHCPRCDRTVAFGYLQEDRCSRILTRTPDDRFEYPATCTDNENEEETE